MLREESTTIKGVEYKVSVLPYELGRGVLFRLYKAGGPALADAVANAPELPKDMNLADVSVRSLGPAFSAAVKGLARDLSEEDFTYVSDVLAEYTQMSKTAGKWVQLKPEMQFHFAGNFGEMFQWLGFAIKVNFGGFTGGQGLLSDLLAKAKRVTELSQSSSIGTPTE